MERRRIGRTGLETTEIGFGTAGIGGLYRAVARKDAMAVLEEAWDAGMRYFDTAPFYGLGLAERRTGDFLRRHERGSYVLSTKVGRLLKAVPEGEIPDYGYVEPLPFRVEYDYSHDAVMRSVEFSLARLGLGRVDILYVHDIGEYTHGADATKVHLRQLLDGGLKALERLKDEGSIGAYGLGVNEVPICMEVMARAPIDVILLAGRYTLLDRAGEGELIPLCREKGTTIVVGGVFNSGILATGPRPGSNFDYGEAGEAVLSAVRRMETAAAQEGIPLAAAALRFPLREEVVSSVLIGTAKSSSLRRNLDLLETAIPASAWGAFEPAAINRRPPHPACHGVKA